jgi:phosphopantothenate---cysteine ligase (CTP)
VEGSRATALSRARQQIRECRTQACVVNGPGYGEGFGLIAAQGRSRHFADAKLLFFGLEHIATRTGV